MISSAPRPFARRRGGAGPSWCIARTAAAGRRRPCARRSCARGRLPRLAQRLRGRERARPCVRLNKRMRAALDAWAERPLRQSAPPRERHHAHALGVSVLPEPAVLVVRMTGVAVGDAAGHVLPAPAADHPPLFRRVGPASYEQVDARVAEVALLLARRLVGDAGAFRPPQRLRRFLCGLPRRGRFIVGDGVWCGSTARRRLSALHRLLQHVTSSQHRSHFLRQVNGLWHTTHTLVGRFSFLTPCGIREPPRPPRAASADDLPRSVLTRVKLVVLRIVDAASMIAGVDVVAAMCQQ